MHGARRAQVRFRASAQPAATHPHPPALGVRQLPTVDAMDTELIEAYGVHPVILCCSDVVLILGVQITCSK